MHYKTIQDVVAFIKDIPPDDLAKITSKPPTTERAEDQRWRRLCGVYGVDMSPIGATQDKAVYMRIYRAEAALAEARNRMADLEADIGRLQTEVARLHLENDRLMRCGGGG
jgi:hypothetical protein